MIAITHLPQIAAMADSHYFIRKQTDQKNTQTMIRKLNESESLKEISRMISGDQWSETSMEHAKEMKSLQMKQNYTEYVSGDLHIIKRIYQ